MNEWLAMHVYIHVKQQWIPAVENARIYQMNDLRTCNKHGEVDVDVDRGKTRALCSVLQHHMTCGLVACQATESDSCKVMHEWGSYQGSFMCVLYEGIARVLGHP